MKTFGYFSQSTTLLLCILLIISSCEEREDREMTPEQQTDPCITSQSGNHGNIIPGEFIIEFSADQSGRSKESLLRTMNIDAREAGSYYVAKLHSEQADMLRESQAIKAIEPDRVISMCACFTVEEPLLITWNVASVGYGDGRGKTAWIIDTGIEYTHPDLTVDQGRSKSFVEGASTANDDNGHGTHVAGIIGARNNTFGTLGVAAGANLVSVKILDENGDGKLSYAIKALQYIRENGQAGDVVNISISLDDISEILDKEISAVADKGIFVAIAAGNDTRMASVVSPSRINGANIFTVSAVDSLKRFASFSNFGNDAVDYAAPGVRVLSTYKGGKYAYMSGTSMAAPHVAGILLVNRGKVNSYGVALKDPDGTPDPLAHQ